MLTPTPFQDTIASCGIGGISNRSMDMIGTAILYDGDVEIYGQEEPADHLYKVITGAVRGYKVLSDGRRQIGSFYMPGDIFGLEIGDKHTFSSETVCQTRILAIRRSSLLNLVASDKKAALQLWAIAAREMQRAQDHSMMLIKTAPERVATFLLEIADNVSDEVDLPMKRRDIADYLGLTIETLARTLSFLEKSGVIERSAGRRITLRSRSALNSMTT
jgi:CRP/FNR family nitrogen fixation transcriptional regulator